MVAWAPPKVQETGETPPKGRSVPKAAPGRPSTRSLKTEISGLIMTLNVFIMMIPPVSKDALDMVEMDALADALDDQCKRSQKFRKAMESALSAGAGGTLFGIVAIIGARRAARHGVIGGEKSEEVDQMLGNLLAQGMNATKKARADAGLA